jgi:hypothetical protein
MPFKPSFKSVADQFLTEGADRDRLAPNTCRCYANNTYAQVARRYPGGHQLGRARCHVVNRPSGVRLSVPVTAAHRSPPLVP